VSTWAFEFADRVAIYTCRKLWCQDVRTLPTKRAFRKGFAFQTKPEDSLEQIRQADGAVQVPVGVVLADAGYGKGTPIPHGPHSTRIAVYGRALNLTATVWEPGQQPLPAPARKTRSGSLPKRLQRNADHQPISVKQLALGLPSSAWKEIGGAKAVKRDFALPAFAAVSAVRPAHRDYIPSVPSPIPKAMALIEWAEERILEAHQILVLTLPEKTSLKSLVKISKTPLDHRTRL